MGRTAEAVAEGVAIAAAAARLSVRNRILIGTIAEGGAFEEDAYLAEAAEALRSLADESEEVARHLTEQRKRAHGRHADPMGTHDYRNRDIRNLRKRAKQSTALAARLREMASDPAQLAALVEDARAAAWADVRGNLDRRLRVEGMRADQDPDYETMREARMEALRLVDLASLAADQRAKQAASEA